jgi:hypothetical protein
MDENKVLFGEVTLWKLATMGKLPVVEFPKKIVSYFNTIVVPGEVTRKGSQCYQPLQ